MRKKLFFILAFMMLIFLSYRVLVFHFHSTRDLKEDKNGKYSLYEFSLPRSIAFAGEKIPLEDHEVRDRLVRILLSYTYENTRSIMHHKQAARWFPMIQRILEKYHVPDDFKYLALVESGFGSEVSVAGASGFWQFIPATAAHYGLEITEQVDERYEPERATIAACKYILDCHRIFNNWTLTAASYNMGPEALQKQMQRQKERSYFDLLLNRETSLYLFKVLAMKEIISRPEFYGYRIKKKQLYAPLPVFSVHVDSSITDIKTFAKANGTTVSLLKKVNPWLLGERLDNPTNKKYVFKILKPGYENLPGIIQESEQVILHDSVEAKPDSLRP